MEKIYNVLFENIQFPQKSPVLGSRSVFGWDHPSSVSTTTTDSSGGLRTAPPPPEHTCVVPVSTVECVGFIVWQVLTGTVLLILPGFLQQHVLSERPPSLLPRCFVP